MQASRQCDVRRGKVGKAERLRTLTRKDLVRMIGLEPTLHRGNRNLKLQRHARRARYKHMRNFRHYARPEYAWNNPNSTHSRAGISVPTTFFDQRFALARPDAPPRRTCDPRGSFFSTFLTGVTAEDRFLRPRIFRLPGLSATVIVIVRRAAVPVLCGLSVIRRRRDSVGRGLPRLRCPAAVARQFGPTETQSPIIWRKRRRFSRRFGLE